MELIKAKDISRAMSLMEDHDVEVSKALCEYNPKSHAVMGRRDKTRKGQEDYRTEKLPRTRQRYINEVELFFLLGNPIKWKVSDESGDADAFSAYKQFLREIRFDSKMRQAKRLAGAETQSAKLYHIYRDEATGLPDGYLDLTTLMVPAAELKAKAKEYGVTVTELLCAAMMQAIADLQAEKVPRRSRRKPVKVLLPVNLRNFFPSRTLRNFASYVTPEIDPRLGEYSFEEICAIVHHRMGLENNPQAMRAKFAINVASEKSPFLKVMPLFVKNLAMKAVFDAVGECKSCLCLSNLGNVRLPEAMAPYIARMDFIIGVQAKAPHNCGVASWNGTTYINCIRNIREPELELHFYQVLHELGLPVKAESNQR